MGAVAIPGIRAFAQPGLSFVEASRADGSAHCFEHLTHASFRDGIALLQRHVVHRDEHARRAVAELSKRLAIGERIPPR